MAVHGQGACRTLAGHPHNEAGGINRIIFCRARKPSIVGSRWGDNAPGEICLAESDLPRHPFLVPRQPLVQPLFGHAALVRGVDVCL